MTLLIIVCLGLCGLLLIIIHACKRAPVPAPDWPERVSGLCYAPYRPGQDPNKKIYPSKAQIHEDLILLSTLTSHIRTYSVEGTLGYIPEMAEPLGLTVTLGIWISNDDESNRHEIALAIELTERFPCIKRIIVGSESLYRGDATFEQLVGYLHLVRQQVNVPLSTSEQWHQWRDLPMLAEHVDFIAAHVLPYWEGRDFLDTPAYVAKRALQLRQSFPGKPVLLSEIGWPSHGNVTRRSGLSREQQAISLRQQVNALDRQGDEYCVIEAFDQDWKTDEGITGQHWGIFTAQRNIKLQLKGPVSVQADWSSTLLFLSGNLQSLGSPRRVITAGLILYSVLVLASISQILTAPLWISLPVVLCWAAFTLGILGVEIHEWLESIAAPEQPRLFLPIRDANHYRPPLSIHIACFNEPPHMVIQTLEALNRLHYPDFEVLIMDNNTCDPAIWKPVQAHCQRLGSRFRFFHVNPLPGFKAGALNYLIDQTCPSAQVIAVIDADYCVNRNWLYEMVPHFADSNIVLIQAPQDYRDATGSLFKRFCNAEYRGFFTIGMVIRNNHNAIIQHGTMTLMRRSALQALRWAPWCICEDAELGLRFLEKGYSTGYLPVSQGKGLIPDNFLNFKKQRYRWAYGAIQIIKHHAQSLIFARHGNLSAAQRYHFLAGWVPWMSEGINYLLIFASLFWSVIMLNWPEKAGPAPWLFAAPPILMLLVRTVKIFSLYDRFVSTDLREAFAATVAGMALYPTIGKAVLSGIFTHRLPFFRTPKTASGHGVLMALAHVREEGCLVLSLWAAALGLVLTGDLTADMVVWIALLLTQSLPCLAAVAMALLSCSNAVRH